MKAMYLLLYHILLIILKHEKIKKQTPIIINIIR